MTKQSTPDYFTNEQKLQFQRKLSYFLKKIRMKRNMQSKEMAEHLGYTPTRYGQLESETTPHPRFIGAINFLASIFTLEDGMNLTEFTNFLEGDSSRVGRDNVLKRKLLKWEKSLLKAFDPIDRKIREEFVEECALGKPHEVLEEKIAIINELNSLNLKDLKRLKKVISSLRNT